MGPTQTSTKVTNPVINLNLLDKHIDECFAIINKEIDKGANADTSLMIRMIITVTGYLHYNDTALNRTQQKIHSFRVDEQHPNLIEQKKNTWTQRLHAGSGTVGVVSFIAISTFTIATALMGAPPADISAILNAPQLMLDGLSRAIGKFADSSASGDQARSMSLEYVIQVIQREINESQSNVQNSKGHETEALRQLKEFFEAEKQHRATIMRSTAVST